MEHTFDPHGLHTRMAAEFVKINALPEPNKSLILDFLQNYRYKKKLSSLARKTRVASQFHFFSMLLNRPMKPFGVQDVKDLVLAIEHHEGQRKPYSLHTWKEMMKNVKIWTKWINPDDYPTILLKCKDCLTVQNPYSDPKRKARLEDFLITEETFLKLLHVANDQYKAMLAIGFGCGARTGELLGLRRKDLKFNSDGTVSLSFLESKTFPRENILLAPDLGFHVRTWYEKSPVKERDDFFFCTVNGVPKPLTNQHLNMILKRLMVCAGLGEWKNIRTPNGHRYSKYVGPRIYFTKFRRAAATWALKNLKSQALAGKRIWGNEASTMIKIYSGLVSEDANEAYREAIGLAQPDQIPSVLKPKTCFKCQGSMPLGQSICPTCQIETDADKIINSQLQKDAEMAALREEMKMMQTAIAQLAQTRKGG